MTPVPFDEDYVAAQATEKVYARGEALYEDEAAEDVVRRGADLYATVWGSEESPYHLRVRLTDDGVAEAVCTCPYSFEGWCKHLVALALRAVRMPASIPDRPPLAEALDRLDAAQLRAVLLTLADDDPALVEQIEGLADMV
ncbi:MAG TPA: SWIM zinc finger family protein [Rhodothermales bacterium]|nr:SWIM zinc finger family protein [Rhodothermales bacterium]